MDRRLLDSLYRASPGSPRVFQRATSVTPIGSDAYQFLLDHAEELDVITLIALLGADLASDVAPVERPFLRRLAAVLPEAGFAYVLDVLALADRISPEAWIAELTLALRGRLPNYQWYRFVDKSRGGLLFNALNVGMPKWPVWNPDHQFPDHAFITSLEETRPEPIVVGLLDRAHDDLAAARFALEKLPVCELLRLHQRFPDLIARDALIGVVAPRARAGESWVQGGDMVMPAWMAPYVAERIRHCEVSEARALYTWLFEAPGKGHGDAFELALARFRLEPTERFWHPLLGQHLRTGAAWKTRGRELLAAALDLGKGFPREVLSIAIATTDGEGASADEHRESILRKAHDVTAGLLIKRAEQALMKEDRNGASRFLSAFLSLDPGSFVRGAVHHLRKIPNLPREIVLQIDACEDLAKLGNREPSVQAILDAFGVLTGELS